MRNVAPARTNSPPRSASPAFIAWGWLGVIIQLRNLAPGVAVAPYQRRQQCLPDRKRGAPKGRFPYRAQIRHEAIFVITTDNAPGPESTPGVLRIKHKLVRRQIVEFGGGLVIHNNQVGTLLENKIRYPDDGWQVPVQVHEKRLFNREYLVPAGPAVLAKEAHRIPQFSPLLRIEFLRGQ
jgi:hypothetical protein